MKTVYYGEDDPVEVFKEFLRCSKPKSEKDKKDMCYEIKNKALELIKDADLYSIVEIKQLMKLALEELVT